MTGHLKEDAEDAADALDDLARAADKAKRRTESTKAAAGDLGGELASLGGMIGGIPIPGFEGLGRAVTAAGDTMEAMTIGTGPLIIALGGTVAAIGATSAAIVGMVLKSKEWLATLEEANKAGGLVTEDERAAIMAASLAVDSMTVSLQQLGVEMSGEFASSVVGFLDTLTGAIEKTRELWKATEGLRRAYMSIANVYARLPHMTPGGLIAGVLGGGAGDLQAKGEAARHANTTSTTADLMRMLTGQDAPTGFDDAIVTGDVWDTKKGGKAGKAAKVEEFGSAFAEQVLLANKGYKTALDQIAGNVIETGETFKAGAVGWIDAVALMTDATADNVLADKAERRAKLSAGFGTGLGIAGGAVSGGAAGMLGAIPGMAGAGAAMGIIQAIGKNPQKFANSLAREISNFPQLLADVIGKGVPSIITNIPDIIVALVKSFPELVSAIVLELPMALAKAIVAALAEPLKGLKKTFRNRGKGPGNFINRTTRGIFGKHDTIFNRGGTYAFGKDGPPVNRSSSGPDATSEADMAQTRDRTNRRTGGGSSGSVTMQVGTLIGNDEAAILDLTRRIQRAVSRGGSNASLTPLTP